MTKEEQETAEMDCLRCYNQGYEVGKKDTIKKACEWLRNSDIYVGMSMRKFIDDFRKAMEE